MQDAAILESETGLRLRAIPFGARLTHLWVPDRNGKLADVALGAPSDAEYAAMPGYFGATCGRYAGRIAGARFDLDGRTYPLVANENGNQLHGGPEGADSKIWSMKTSPNEVKFGTVLQDGEMGYPGRCAIDVSYRLEGSDLTIEMTAEADAPTPVNIVNHAYFNLSGGGTIRDHHLSMAASRYLPVTPDLIPTGERRTVAGTVFDFTEPDALGARMDAIGGAGFDHTWCVDGEGMRPLAVLSHPPSGRRLRISSNQPGLQMYTGGYIGPAMIGKSGRGMEPFAGIALEAQAYPNSPNEPGFPNTILRPGEQYRNTVKLNFSADARPA